MIADTHRILPAWPEQLVYEELDAPDESRRIEFNCRSLSEPVQVEVPAAARWADDGMPPWAFERRELILQRLRDAHCVVFEIEAERATALSPDGALLIEQQREFDDRSGLWETLRVLALPGREVLVHVLNYGGSSGFAFPAPGLLEFEVTDRLSRRHRVRLDAPNHRYALLPDGATEPLAMLPERLGMVTSIRLYEPPGRRPLVRRIGTLLAAAGSLVLTAGGVWMAIEAPTTKERIIGAVGALFFAACAWLPWAEDRQRRREQDAHAARVAPDTPAG